MNDHHRKRVSGSTGRPPPASELGRRLVRAGRWPNPKLFDAILGQQRQAIRPLLALLRYRRGPTAYFASGLLGLLGAREAIPHLVRVFYGSDLVLMFQTGEALVHIGPEVLEAVLPLIGDPTLSLIARINACAVAQWLAPRNPEVRARVTATFRAVLGELVQQASPLAARDREMVTLLVLYLAQLADPAARGLIELAFERGEVELETIWPAQVEALYQAGGQPVPEYPDGLQRYRDSYPARLASARFAKIKGSLGGWASAFRPNAAHEDGEDEWLG